MARLGWRALWALALGVCLFARSNHGPVQTGERIIAIVPMIGAGTDADPRRPMFCPAGDEIAQAIANHRRPQFTSYHFMLTDDGANAIVEFVAPNRESLRPILQSTDPRVHVFQPGTLPVAEMQRQLRLVKRSFDIRQFDGPALPPGTGGVR